MAWLCVLLLHALVIYSLLHPAHRDAQPVDDSFVSEPITLILEPIEEVVPEVVPAKPAPASSARHPIAPAPAQAAGPTAGESAPITPPARVDWPIEGKKSAARVLAAEAEAERVAKLFAGPTGTWLSLTKRQRSKISKFRWKPGVDGLERDANGNTIYHMSEGCVLVNFSIISCAIGKPTIHDDMFDNMRLYFDEQRLPYTDEGNGTEPGAQPRP